MCKNVFFLLLLVFFICPQEGYGQSFFDKLGKVIKEVDKAVNGEEKAGKSEAVADDKKEIVAAEKNKVTPQEEVPEKEEAVPAVTSPHPDLAFKVKRCVAAGNNALIDLLVTNSGGILNLRLQSSAGNNAIAYDEEGNTYGVMIDFGSTSTNMYGQRDASCELPSGVAVKCRLRIEGVDAAAKTFSMIKVNCRSDAGYSLLGKEVIIKNVGIVR